MDEAFHPSSSALKVHIMHESSLLSSNGVRHFTRIGGDGGGGDGEVVESRVQFTRNSTTKGKLVNQVPGIHSKTTK